MKTDIHPINCNSFRLTLALRDSFKELHLKSDSLKEDSHPRSLMVIQFKEWHPQLMIEVSGDMHPWLVTLWCVVFDPLPCTEYFSSGVSGMLADRRHVAFYCGVVVEDTPVV